MLKLMLNTCFLVTLISGCSGQDYPLPEIESTRNTDFIKYSFPTLVIDALQKYFDDRKEGVGSSLIVYSSLGPETHELNLFVWDKEAFRDEIDRSSKLSNRVLILEDYKIPIILNSDFQFSDMGFTMSGSSFHVKFKASSSESKCNILSTSKY